MPPADIVRATGVPTQLDTAGQAGAAAAAGSAPAAAAATLLAARAAGSSVALAAACGAAASLVEKGSRDGGSFARGGWVKAAAACGSAALAEGELDREVFMACAELDCWNLRGGRDARLVL